ncbi:hypothetical protein ACLMJK_007822 [Lecanora helva]
MATLIHPSTDEGYILNRDFLAATRLNSQHWLWRMDLGYNLHPSIAVPPQANIAEIATGTGAWLLEVAREFPDSRCDGFDISLQQAPQQTWLPDNVTMRTWDIYEPPPQDLVGKYDIVHIRLIALAVPNKDVTQVVKNASLLLKPRGWLQWDELDVTDTTIMHTAGETGKVDTVKKMDYLMKAHGSDEWVLKRPALMQELGGFAEIEQHRVQPAKSLLKFTMDNSLGSWQEIISNQPVGGEQRKMYEELAVGLAEEVREGAVHGVAKLVCVGRKAA